MDATQTTWLLLTCVLSFLMSFAIGANDGANGLGTSYGTMSLPVRVLIAIGAIGALLGALFCSGAVTDKLARGMISNLDKVDAK